MRTTFPVTVHLLFFREDQVLLLRRFNTGYADGQYSVPAGHLDGGETVIAAARREGLEEIGVHIEAGDVVFSSVVHRRDGDERVDFFVHVHKWQGEPANTEPDKCDELRGVDVNELPDNVIPYVKKA
ncbi:MAG TPA: NUDIX domain-containing protein, partial [Anaerolineales bacterium]|nr:NUDIX domain-containing protein [Anaerolineales bacterium]